LFAPPFGLLAPGLAGSKDMPARAGSIIIQGDCSFVKKIFSVFSIGKGDFL